MQDKETFVIDIDNHLLFSKLENGQYKIIDYDQEEIQLVNEKFDNGYRIILYTGRSWGHYEVTKLQLENYNIKYDELVMGKPVGIYIDKESHKSLKDFK